MTVKIDKDTNMPELPSNRFWRVGWESLVPVPMDPMDYTHRAFGVGLYEKKPRRIFRGYRNVRIGYTGYEVAENPTAIRDAAIGILKQRLAAEKELENRMMLSGDYPPKKLES